LALDVDESGFDPFVNGKFLAQEATKISRICNLIKRLDDFVSQDFGEFGDEFEGQVRLLSI
jgi:hypothetical protein